MAAYYEFFAGGGMARAGLGRKWECLFANDFDAKKASTYAENWGSKALRVADVSTLKTSDLPGQADLVWGSFPCQDLSLAGAGAGLKGNRSGVFWPFWRLINNLHDEGRAPSLVVLENVCGALTSHDGKDFVAIGDALADSGYRLGAVVLDAVHFVPQSRPRLFVIAVRKDLKIPSALAHEGPDSFVHSPALVQAHGRLSPRAKRAWVWWKLALPKTRTNVFADLIEDEPEGVVWHTQEQTARLLNMMSPKNRQKVEGAKKESRRRVGGIYKRTRLDEFGKRVQRAEIRFDDVAGCLRTPTGGSSRQSIMVVEGAMVKSRLLSPREAVRLMGLPDSYKLPKNYNEAYHIAGDGLVVPVVRHLAANILEPLLRVFEKSNLKAA